MSVDSTVAVQFRYKANTFLVRYLLCTKTKHLFAKTAGKNSFSQQVNRNFMRRKALRMSLSAAESVVWHASRAEAVSVNFIRPSAESAVARPEFPLSPRATEVSFAVPVLRR